MRLLARALLLSRQGVEGDEGAIAVTATLLARRRDIARDQLLAGRARRMRTRRFHFGMNEVRPVMRGCQARTRPVANRYAGKAALGRECL
ncbi:hypothetical protein TM102_61850 [Bradyrhizobium sp. TM102]|nr:hypothetical protein TM102_61850 [Bradyrhizobium sp. TM102]